MIKILLGIILLFLSLFLESLFLRVFSFSIFIIITISLWKRVDDIFFYSFITLFGIILDTVLHVPLGVHLIVIVVLLMFTDIFWLFVHRDSISGYIGVFLFITLYYILIPLVSSLFQEGIFTEISLGRIIEIIICSLVSTLICVFVDRFVKSIRSERNSKVLRLS